MSGFQVLTFRFHRFSTMSKRRTVLSPPFFGGRGTFLTGPFLFAL
jgi:hypothetical protein